MNGELVSGEVIYRIVSSDLCGTTYGLTIYNDRVDRGLSLMAKRHER